MPDISPADARRLATDAYIDGFPLVDNYRIRHSYFVERGNPEFKTGWNQIYNIAFTFLTKPVQVPTP